MSLPSPSSTILLGGAVLVAFAVIQSVWRYQREQRENGNTPGYKLIISNTGQIQAVLPAIQIPFTKDWYFNIGLTWWGVHDHNGKPSSHHYSYYLCTAQYSRLMGRTSSLPSVSGSDVQNPCSFFYRSQLMERRCAT
jgi:hypothetical protein